MTEALRQMARADLLLVNWDSLRLSIGPMAEAQAAEFIELGRRLAAARDVGEAAEILDQLFELVRNTPGAAYMRELTARAQLEDESGTRGRNVVGVAKLDLDEALTAGPRAIESTASLGLQLTGVSQPLGVKQVSVLFATNRKATGPSATAFLGVDGGEVKYGVATVSIPAVHQLGKLEKPHFWNTKDAEKYVLLQDVDSLNQADFAAKLGEAALKAKSPEILVFLHGFNVTFEEAALRAAQFAEDSSFEGVVVLYSWPSRGFVRDYFADEDTAVASGGGMAKMLRGLEGGPWQKVHLLAHSMGSRVMLSGIADNDRPKLPLTQLVFAAADVGVPLFNEKFPKVQEAGRLRATSYASGKDRALWLSSLLHRGPRVGMVDGIPYCIDQLDSIDVTAVSNGILGHGYWSEQRPLLSDLLALLDQGRPPGKRGLRAVGPYWEFPR
jgi:esterase/lipase superfamily enzyme